MAWTSCERPRRISAPTQWALLASIVLFFFGSMVANPSLAQNSVVRVDVTKTREAISPYIYGQFIEHLGRCIYGGIWAEMLEDRKFYYPVDGEAPAWNMYTPPNRSWDGAGHPYELLTRSPWMILGDKEAVTMVTERQGHSQMRAASRTTKTSSRGALESAQEPQRLPGSSMEGSYVGEQTPKITLSGDGSPTGLLQERLGVQEGRKYTGRIVLAGDPEAAPIEVSLVWGGGASDRDTVVIQSIGEEFAKFPLSFTSGGSTDNGRIEIVGRGDGAFLIGTTSLMPADNVRGWRADTVALLKQLNAPVYRWPGGNFVSGYDWKDGIGDPDRRPPRKNPAWKGIEHNDVGIHEFMDLCQEIQSEAYIAVNTGLGGAQGAAEEIEYVNGASDTPMGKWRAANGHAQPWSVKWWAIGNEMFGDWQLGHMPLEEYVKKHNQVVDAMRKVDPNFKPIAVGAKGDWSRQMLTTCSDHMDLISEHLYCQDKKDVVEHTGQIAKTIRDIAAAHREYRKSLPSLANKDIRIALDEWNYWYGPNEFGELGTRYFLQDGLGIAMGLHEYFRNSDIYFMANYAQTVNVIGAIKTTTREAEFETTGLVLKLYREHFETIPVQMEADLAPLDLAAARSRDGKSLTISIVNPTDACRRCKVDLAGGALAGKARKWTLSGTGRWSHNSPGKPRQVDIQEAIITDTKAPLESPPLSVTLFQFSLQ